MVWPGESVAATSRSLKLLGDRFRKPFFAPSFTYMASCLSKPASGPKPKRRRVGCPLWFSRRFLRVPENRILGDSLAPMCSFLPPKRPANKPTAQGAGKADGQPHSSDATGFPPNSEYLGFAQYVFHACPTLTRRLFRSSSA
jgi:hypothetical protein